MKSKEMPDFLKFLNNNAIFQVKIYFHLLELFLD